MKEIRTWSGASPLRSSLILKTAGLEVETEDDMSSAMVMNLTTRAKQVYDCTPRLAVLSAYAQSLKDWNTWDYEKRYGHLLLEGKHCLAVGDFSVFKDGRVIE